MSVCTLKMDCACIVLPGCKRESAVEAEIQHTPVLPDSTFHMQMVCDGCECGTIGCTTHKVIRAAEQVALLVGIPRQAVAAMHYEMCL